MNYRRYKGFTIIELMIVMAIILILAIVLIPKGGLAKDKAKNAGKIVDKNTLQGYIDYKWERILDNCNGDKSLADKTLLRDLANDENIKVMVSPTNKNIKGVGVDLLENEMCTKQYINVVKSNSLCTEYIKDRLYIKDGKVIEGDQADTNLTLEEKNNLMRKNIKGIVGCYAYHESKSGTGGDSARVARYTWDDFIVNLDKWEISNVNPYNPKRKGVDTCHEISFSGMWTSEVEGCPDKQFYRSVSSFKGAYKEDLGVISIDYYDGIIYVGVGDGAQRIKTIEDEQTAMQRISDYITKNKIK